MNTKEYIESGILEAYVLGALTPEEEAQVEANMALYPEVVEEIATIEATMLQVAETNAEEPPAGMQERIWETLQKETVEEKSANHSEKKEPQIIAFTPNTPTMQWQRAAMLVVLVGSMLVNLMLWYQRNESTQQQVAMKYQMDSLQAQQQQLALAVNNYRKEKDIAADPGMQTIVMHTLKPEHHMAATVYWSKDKGEAYVSIEKLPMPPKGMQYQMWVIQKGTPVSMGMLPNNIILDSGMQKLSMNVTNGEAFAISLEKEGGNPTPTAENIYVLGKVSS